MYSLTGITRKDHRADFVLLPVTLSVAVLALQNCAMFPNISGSGTEKGTLIFAVMTDC